MRVLHSLLVPALAGLLFAASPLAAASPDAALESEKGMHHKLCLRIFNSTKELLEHLTARITRAESVDLNLIGISMDERHRVFIDLEGMIEFKFKKMSDRIEKKMLDLAGHQMTTNGALAVDFVADVVDRTGENEYHVEFKLGMVLILEEFLSKLVRFGSEVAGTITLWGFGNDLVSFLDGVDVAGLSVSLEQGMRDLTKVVMSIAGVETYDAFRELRKDRAGDGQGGSVTGATLAHLGCSLVKGATGVATNIAGMTLGAMVGAALMPSIGATVGAVIGAAGLHLVGNIVYKKLSVDVPMKFRMTRIRRLHFKRVESTDPDRIEYLTSKIEKFEGKILRRVALEMRTDRFTYLEEFMQQLAKTSERDRQALLPLAKKLQDKLRFEVVEKKDRLADRLLKQLTASMAKGLPESGAAQNPAPAPTAGSVSPQAAPSATGPAAGSKPPPAAPVKGGLRQPIGEWQ